ncbi:MAG: UDP-2-acetamido-3-amino-2,3-dideoxy-D-glucuronate N-acetyltransferase [Firmicutes bacterium ADurb.Bin182]|nr:MAG: UDP-2-acetamido-3-amino-2,3-dideoxy-D-glucuronate N-acetyltransferase [Firmicutes bacterium ADurb.Bin182]
MQTNKNKKICVIGGGSWGGNHIKALHGMGCLAGIAESDIERLGDLVDKYKPVRGHNRVEEALKAGYDGFIVSTPAQTHYEIGSFLLKQKQNVLIEKPLALNSRDSSELVRLSEKHNAKLMVGHLMLFHPAIAKIKQLIDDGAIGDLRYIYSNRLNLGKVRTTENALWSLAPHDISIFNHLTGGLPVSVKAFGGCYLQEGIEDTVLASYVYPGNVLAHVFVSWLHPFKEHRLIAAGSKAMLVFEDSSPEKNILLYDTGIEFINDKPVKRENPAEIIPYDRASPLERELAYFIEHLDSKISLAYGKSGHETIEILEKTDECLKAQSGHAGRFKMPGKKYFIHESSYIDDGASIGEGTKVWHFSHIQKGAVIGRNCSIGQNVNIGSNAVVGNNVKIQNNVSVYEGVVLEDYVFCGPSMVFTNIKTPRSKYPQNESSLFLKTLIKEGASIGANATIVCGHTVGRHAFIAAGAVVTSDVPDYALMAGVPAKRKGWVCECGEQLKDVACKKCGRVYVEEKGSLREVTSSD